MNKLVKNSKKIVKCDDFEIIHDNPAPPTALLSDIRELIESCRQRVAVGVNAELTFLYWNIGKRINDEVLRNQRAEYGKQIVASLARSLTMEFGPEWNTNQVHRMMRFAVAFPDKQIVASLMPQLSWTQILNILPINDPLKREFYIEMCKHERWSVRTLRERIDSMLYERTAISKKPEEVIRRDLELLKNEGKMSKDLVFQDPVFLNLAGLRGIYSEKDLESAIIVEMQHFIAELGSDFAFVARQKRITVDNDDYHMDLLFYHRGLRRLVVVELKLEDFKVSHKAQMELYLRWLNKHERREGENEPLGIILCAGKKQELVELLELGKSGIHIAEYMTELPPRELLEKKLLTAIQLARERFAATQQRKPLKPRAKKKTGVKK